MTASGTCTAQRQALGRNGAVLPGRYRCPDCRCPGSGLDVQANPTTSSRLRYPSPPTPAPPSRSTPPAISHRSPTMRNGQERSGHPALPGRGRFVRQVRERSPFSSALIIGHTGRKPTQQLTALPAGPLPLIRSLRAPVPRRLGQARIRPGSGRDLRLRSGSSQTPPRRRSRPRCCWWRTRA